MKTFLYFTEKGLDFVSGDLFHTFTGDKESSGTSAVDALRGLDVVGNNLLANDWTVHSFAWRVYRGGASLFNGCVDVKLVDGKVSTNVSHSVLISGKVGGVEVAEWRPYVEMDSVTRCASEGVAGRPKVASVSVLSSSQFSGLGGLHEAIHNEINALSGRSCLPVAAYIGVLEMVKSDLMSRVADE